MENLFRKVLSVYNIRILPESIKTNIANDVWIILCSEKYYLYAIPENNFNFPVEIYRIASMGNFKNQ